MNTILVIGATGNQGWAVAEALLRRKNEYKVRVFVRDPGGLRARALKGQGAELCVGSLDEPLSVKAAMEGAYGVFCVTNFMGEGGITKGVLSVSNYLKRGIELERERGIRVADLVEELDVPYLIYSGMARLDDVPSTTGKADVEAYLKELAVRSKHFFYTIVRPASFMRNFEEVRPAPLGYLAYRQSLEDRAPCWVDLEDFGAVVAEMFAHRERYSGKTITVVSAEASYRDIEAAYQGVYDEAPVPWHWQLMPNAALSLAYPFLGHIGKVMRYADSMNKNFVEDAVFEYREPPTSFVDWFLKRKRVYDALESFKKEKRTATEILEFAGASKDPEEAWFLLSVAREMKEK